MSERILFVDDDTNILASFQRGLHKEFGIDIAASPEQGLKQIREYGPYAVVVSDLNMPGMTGITFLSRMHDESPDTVRVMLTGNANLDSAMAAVNEGNIFRFLTKPIQRDVLVKTLQASIAQYKLVTAERELLQKTLSGSVKILTDIMSLASPMAFSRASRASRNVRLLADKLEIEDSWQYELAAMLSQIGCIALPQGILESLHMGRQLTEDEKKAVKSHPAIARKLLANIPRLDSISSMIELQYEPYSKSQGADGVHLGAQMLKIAFDFDTLLTQGMTASAAISKMRTQPGEYNPMLLDALDDVSAGTSKTPIETVKISDLRIHMITAQDVLSKSGMVLVARGQEVTPTVLEHLMTWSLRGEVLEPIRVLTPWRSEPSK
jgi:response regulator RpfG family c-di-GMP phosphodiesterase